MNVQRTWSFIRAMIGDTTITMVLQGVCLSSSVHHVDHIAQIIQSFGALVDVLPPYSTDLNQEL